MTNLPQFKIRASCIGKIMTESRSKTGLSETAKTYCEEWLISQIYNREKDTRSKYMNKGNEVEQLGIDRYNRTFNTFHIKNDEKFEIDWLTGTPDIIVDDKIIDIKSSWDCFTFPLLETEIPTKDYYWQLQAYMYLTNKQKAELTYVLENYTDQYGNEQNYDDVDDKYRMKIFELDYDASSIVAIQQRVEECREYIELLKIKN